MPKCREFNLFHSSRQHSLPYLTTKKQAPLLRSSCCGHRSGGEARLVDLPDRLFYLATLFRSSAGRAVAGSNPVSPIRRNACESAGMWTVPYASAPTGSIPFVFRCAVAVQRQGSSLKPKGAQSAHAFLFHASRASRTARPAIARPTVGSRAPGGPVHQLECPS